MSPGPIGSIRTTERLILARSAEPRVGSKAPRGTAGRDVRTVQVHPDGLSRSVDGRSTNVSTCAGGETGGAGLRSEGQLSRGGRGEQATRSQDMSGQNWFVYPVENGVELVIDSTD